MPLLKAPQYFGHYSSRVNRPYNEDKYYAGVLELPAGSSLAPKSIRTKLGVNPSDCRQVFNFAVFDGHGGQECSEFLKQHLPEYVEKCDMKSGEELAKSYKKKFGGYWRAWNNEISRYISRLTPFDDLQLRLPLAFLQADMDFSSAKDLHSGSTCTSVYIYSIGGSADNSKAPVFWDKKSESRLLVAHLGDTRCILVDKYGTAEPLTSEHHPSSPIEATRLQRFASRFFTDSFGEERFEMFANTRSFGDAPAKGQGISAEPEIIECSLGPSRVLKRGDQKSDDYVWEQSKKYSTKVFDGSEAMLILMSDGVTNFMSDEEVADLAIATAQKHGSNRGTPQDAAEEVVRFVEDVGGDDNATCLVIRLSAWGDWEWKDSTAGIRESRLQDALDRPAGRRTR